MKRPRYNRAVIGLMLLAAFATYADTPRLAGTLLIGGAVNYAAALDGLARAALQARHDALPAGSAEREQLAQRMDDGNRSLAVVEGMPTLPGVIAPQGCHPRLEVSTCPPGVEHNPDSGLVAIMFSLPATTLAQPPPTVRTGRNAVPCHTTLTRTTPARGPPRCA